MNTESHLNLSQGPNKEEVPFQRDLEQLKWSSWSDLASRSDHGSPCSLQIQVCIWPFHWKLIMKESKCVSGNICQWCFSPFKRQISSFFPRPLFRHTVAGCFSYCCLVVVVSHGQRAGILHLHVCCSRAIFISLLFFEDTEQFLI